MANTDPGGGEGDTHFGFATLPLADKQGRVDDVFHKVARRYDLMNDLMSGGLHRAWKDVLAARAAGPRRAARRHLDLAGGTGDVAFRIAEAAPGTHVTVLDINADMLAVGRERAGKRGLADRVTFVEGNAEDLPFEAASFDGATIAFGIRNVPRIARALSETHRVLRRGARFQCLEFSSVDVPGLDRLYDAFSFSAIPAIGKAVAGDGEPYRYLVESIRKFPQPEDFARMVAAAGFSRASFERLSGGIVALHSGWKL
ncbi:MAG: bifunctional demethylmenaquinone methyltransferase/2-methoxy-6-polyprenyl-1,4-benzoquinol methylase UbiE [Hyphomicrobiales bacterium]|nr:bifunctional demethylmenaquinone methyltransferase/2-methoxy-6-polyprenyl-1,4-benzoquinol methylase UbiE [Hyphomicrobiales bacterium]MDE2016091.1 bifunctional demethylmenaquinone methyltransferase/2-methoxy-6-polyprenyl-1,4-benzoquinol methylase UbiE [Hyphomicrobiales bacterium]